MTVWRKTFAQLVTNLYLLQWWSGSPETRLILKSVHSSKRSSFVEVQSEHQTKLLKVKFCWISVIPSIHWTVEARSLNSVTTRELRKDLALTYLMKSEIFIVYSWYLIIIVYIKMLVMAFGWMVMLHFICYYFCHSYNPLRKGFFLLS